jgi:hypothetical protein
MKYQISQSKSAQFNQTFYLESDFYRMAPALREQFEEQVLIVPEANGGMTPLVYAVSQDRLQFLTATAEHIFTGERLEDLIDRLGAWAGDVLGVSHVSTPQVRVYINGCGRELLQDAVSTQWHYMLSLTRSLPRRKTGWVKVVTSSISQAADDYSVDQIVSLQLEFNQLLVHKTTHPYGVDVLKTSMNPLDGVVFLDGYIW